MKVRGDANENSIIHIGMENWMIWKFVYLEKGNKRQNGDHNSNHTYIYTNLYDIYLLVRLLRPLYGVTRVTCQFYVLSRGKSASIEKCLKGNVHWIRIVGLTYMYTERRKRKKRIYSLVYDMCLQL